MIRREIKGPQERFERTGLLRDVRPLGARLWEALTSELSGVILALGGAVMVFEPAAFELVLPFSLLYAAIVLTRPAKLPMRLPKSARRKDWNYPDPGTRKPRQAAGTIYLGRDIEGRELWISPEDARQHAAIPGTTGAGKTAAILSFLVNALTHGSGFVLVDGKADSKLIGEVLALARRFGRDDDVLHLNLLVASGSKESHTFNPFAAGNADAIREMVISQLGEQSAQDSNGVFRSRAVALMGSVIPALVWLRDNIGISIDIETIRDCLELRVIWKLGVKKKYEKRDRRTGAVEDIPVDLPQEIAYPLQAYLGEIPGYDLELDYDKQKSQQPRDQHGYARFYFTETFTQLGGSLGHIFKAECGDIDMRDVVLNRRILVVSLPALENSSDTLAGLGKIVVAALRGMMAQMLHTPARKLAPEAPFHVVLDELAYYAADGLDRMLAQGRSLNIMFWLAFQEVSGIVARLGEKTHTLLGNANLTIAMRQQDAKRTREWIEETAGQALVAQAASYRGGEAGGYWDSREASVRQVARVDWLDLQRLIEGEAILLFGGRRIYAKLFYAALEGSGPVRLARPVALAPPDRARIEAERKSINEIARSLTQGAAGAGPRAPQSPALRAMVEAFAAKAAEGAGGEACADAAIEAASQAPPARQESDAAVRLAGLVEKEAGRKARPVRDIPMPKGKVSAELFGKLVGIAMANGTRRGEARETALRILGVREKALAGLPCVSEQLASEAEFFAAVEGLKREAERPAASPALAAAPCAGPGL